MELQIAADVIFIKGLFSLLWFIISPLLFSLLASFAMSNSSFLNSFEGGPSPGPRAAILLFLSDPLSRTTALPNRPRPFASPSTPRDLSRSAFPPILFSVLWHFRLQVTVLLFFAFQGCYGGLLLKMIFLGGSKCWKGDNLALKMRSGKEDEKQWKLESKKQETQQERRWFQDNKIQGQGWEEKQQVKSKFVTES